MRPTITVTSVDQDSYLHQPTIQSLSHGWAANMFSAPGPSICQRDLLVPDLDDYNVGDEQEGRKLEQNDDSSKDYSTASIAARTQTAIAGKSQLRSFCCSEKAKSVDRGITRMGHLPPTSYRYLKFSIPEGK